MARTVTSYAQWYVNATAKVAQDAHRMMMQDPALQCGVAVYLYYKRHGLEFAAIPETKDSSGYELVTGERMPTDLDVLQLICWVRQFTNSVPVLPGD